jgi:predicted small lipoprotein YifL
VKRYFSSLLMVCIMTLLMALTACTSKSPETTPVLSEKPPATTVPTPAITDYSGLGLTDLEIQTLKERGIANVDSATVASKIAGFKVYEPSYVPEGYSGGKFTVSLSGAGMPEALKPKFNNTKIERIYSLRGDTNTIIDLIQTVNKLNVSGSEPVEICGHSAERSFTKADPKSPLKGDRLSFVWEIDGNYFLLSGWLNGTLNEAALVKMACSINID